MINQVFTVGGWLSVSYNKKPEINYWKLVLVWMIIDYDSLYCIDSVIYIWRRNNALHIMSSLLFAEAVGQIKESFMQSLSYL